MSKAQMCKPKIKIYENQSSKWTYMNQVVENVKTKGSLVKKSCKIQSIFVESELLNFHYVQYIQEHIHKCKSLQ